MEYFLVYMRFWVDGGFKSPFKDQKHSPTGRLSVFSKFSGQDGHNWCFVEYCGLEVKCIE